MRMTENTARTSTPFLRLVASDLLKRFGTNLAELTVVFPSRRARLFFNQRLYEEIKRPLWAPQYVSIEELFTMFGTDGMRYGAHPVRASRISDPIQLIGELYRSYVSVYYARSGKPLTETLDEFFFFGEILLRDFDDIDKNLANAKLLFSNLQDLDRLKDDFSHLSENQLDALRRFGNIFAPPPTSLHEDREEGPVDISTKLKSEFASIWNILGDVYEAFKENLRSQGIAYSGMLMRDALENEQIEFSGKQYVFVGFNALNKCEEQLFRRLKHKSLFYWDYDAYYLHSEAGGFIRKNIGAFGSALDDSQFDVFLKSHKEITFLSASTESGQTGIIPSWIDSLGTSTDFTAPDTAIVLCNESILPVVIHAVPASKVENVNITMGFPIIQTPVAGFLLLLSDLHTKGYRASGVFHYKYVLPVLRHPYTKLIFPDALEVEKEITQGNIFYPDEKKLRDETIFSTVADATELGRYFLEIVERLGKEFKRYEESEDVYHGLYQESIFRAYQVVNRLYGLMQSGWSLEKPTFLRLLRKLLSMTHVPFHGEPVKGLQIMGVLETRTLDFKHLLLLSVNEGFMPGNANDNTFIPEFLRKHFGLSTGDHQDSMYAYYFYRLIQRAEKITCVYNTDKTLTGKAEMSRFLLQLLIDQSLPYPPSGRAEGGIIIRRYTLQSAIKPRQAEPLIIPKTDEILLKIKQLYDFNTNPQAKPLTPSNLNTFIDCSLRFYLQKIQAYESPDELSDELDSSVFGTIFHRAAESLYHEIGRTEEQKNFSPFVVEKSHLDIYLLPETDYRIRKLVSGAFEKEFFKGRTVDESQYNGEQLINFNVICKMLKRLIEFDRQRTPFTIVGLEWKDYHFIHIPLRNDGGETSVSLKIGGIIDRLEEKDGKMWIIDYKTGGSAKTYKTLEELVSEKDKRAAHIFQTFVYASVFSHLDTSDTPIVPALLYLQDTGKENYSPVIVHDKAPIGDFRELNPAFEDLYIEKISALFDPCIPFRQTAFESNCSYCEFKELCNR